MSSEVKLTGLAPLPAGWPRPFGEDARIGLAGRFLRAVETQTEADPSALLVSLLLGFGSMLGRSAYFETEAVRHHANLFAVVVGRTARARKGTSWAHVARLLELVDGNWLHDRVKHGVGSGEAIVHAVRDRNDARDDDGAIDKRLLIQESEFAQLLKIARRDGNVTSPVLRSAWDGGTLETLTKGSPARATDAHVAMLGHVTHDELRRCMAEVEIANGLANRVLWVCSARARLLPRGGQVQASELDALATELRDRVERGRRTGSIVFDPDADSLWHELYTSELSRDVPGTLGAATSRAEPQTLRLSLIYALLDGEGAIRPPHLRAAVAVWRYCFQSARFLFGDATGDPIAERVREQLEQSDWPLSRTDIHRKLSGHCSADDLDRALDSLEAIGALTREVERVAGRSVVRWRAAKSAKPANPARERGGRSQPSQNSQPDEWPEF